MVVGSPTTGLALNSFCKLDTRSFLYVKTLSPLGSSGTPSGRETGQGDTSTCWERTRFRRGGEGRGVKVGVCLCMWRVSGGRCVSRCVGAGKVWWRY